MTSPPLDASRLELPRLDLPRLDLPRLDLPRLDLGLADLAADYDLLLCDVWGVIHNGVVAHAAAVDALCRFRAGGGSVVLVTNAPVPQAQVRGRMDRLGVPHDAYDDVATSGDVTIGMIVEAGCPPLLHIGPRDEVQLYAAAAAQGARAPELVTAERAELAICVGLDDTREAPEDYDDELGALRERSLTLVCANPDIVVEVGDDLVWCAGAIAARYAAIGGTLVQAGKPFPAIYERALAMAREVRGSVDRNRVLAIGDAFATDMRGARNQALDALLVTGGIHRADLHEDARIDRAKLVAMLAGEQLGPRAALPYLRWRATD